MRQIMSIALGVCLVASMGANVKTYKFEEIEYPGAFTTATGINDNREVVGYYQYDLKGPFHAFHWKDGIYTNIDVPGVYSTVALGINNQGKILGMIQDPGRTGGTVLREMDEDGMNWRALDSWPQVRPSVITNRNQVAGDYWQDGQMGHWVMAIKTGITNIVPGPSSNLYSMNGAGVMVFDGTVVKNGATTILELPGAYLTHGYSINDRGWIAGVGMVMVGSQQRQHGYVFKNSYEVVDYPEAWHTGLTGINNNGDVVGYASGIPENGTVNWYNEAFVRLVQ